MSKKSTWDDWGDDLDDEEPRSLATIGLEEDEAPRSLATIGLPEEEVESSRRSLANIGLEDDEAPRSLATIGLPEEEVESSRRSLANIGLEPAEREQPRGGRGAEEEEEEKEEEASGGGSRSLENIGLEGEDEHMAITWECFACGTKNPVTKMHCSKCMCAVTVSNQQRGAAAGRNLQGNLGAAAQVKKDKAVSMDATHQADGLGAGGSGGGDVGGNRPRAASAGQGAMGGWIGWAAGGVLSGVGAVAGGAVRGVGAVAGGAVRGVGTVAGGAVRAVASLSPRSGQAAATAAASGEGTDAEPSSPVPATAPPSPPAAPPAGADMTIGQAFGSVMRRSNNTSVKQRSKGGGKAD